MKIRLFSFSVLLTATAAQAQFAMSNVQYWIGSGSDSSVLVVDFLDGSFDPSHAWGYLHDGTATAEDMFDAIDAADINLQIDMVDGSINTIIYNSHSGVGGSPNYWGSWTGTGIADMTMNGGATEPLSNGEWFGCSYTDLDPAVGPGEPQAAFDPFSFDASEVTYWIGTGADSALLMIDFQDGTDVECYVWGFRFDGSTTGDEMLTAISSADPALEVEFAGGFLNTINYGAHAGIGGSPDYWSTWSATNMGSWQGNLGTATEVSDGGFFGCSYTDFDPALRPFAPVPATSTTSMIERGDQHVHVYPQPAHDVLNVDAGAANTTLVVFDPTGRRVHSVGNGTGLRSIDVSAWPAGMYVIDTGLVKRTVAVQ